MNERMPIPGFIGFYEASRDGGIYSVERVIQRASNRPITIHARKLSAANTKSGYLKVHLRKNGDSRTHLVHRLVLSAFLDMPPAPNNIVNHKNGVRTDNSVFNLEWCNKSENALHAYAELGAKHAMPKGGLSPIAKPVVGVNIISGIAIKFAAMTDAVEYGCTVTGISSCISGKQKTHRNMTWSLA